MKLGKVIKFYRTQSGFKQAELADLAGINDKYYGKIERDESSPTVEKLHLIVTALSISMSEFFREYERQNNKQPFD